MKTPTQQQQQVQLTIRYHVAADQELIDKLVKGARGELVELVIDGARQTATARASTTTKRKPGRPGSLSEAAEKEVARLLALPEDERPSQATIAEKVGVSRSTIAHMAQGRRPVKARPREAKKAKAS